MTNHLNKNHYVLDAKDNQAALSLHQIFLLAILVQEYQSISNSFLHVNSVKN